MDDDALRRALVSLYALDDGTDVIARQRELDPDAGELRTRCGQALWDRLTDEQVDLRVWLSRLVRDLFLSEAALQRGLGVEDVCDFWSWFDKTMWREAVLRAPSLAEPATAGRPALHSVPASGTGPAPGAPSPRTPAAAVAAVVPAAAVSSAAAPAAGRSPSGPSARAPRTGRRGRALEPVTGSTR